MAWWRPNKFYPGAMVIDQGFFGRIGISSCLSLAATNELLFGSSAHLIRITIIAIMKQNQSHNPYSNLKTSLSRFCNSSTWNLKTLSLLSSVKMNWPNLWEEMIFRDENQNRRDLQEWWYLSSRFRSPCSKNFHHPEKKQILLILVNNFNISKYCPGKLCLDKIYP